MLRSGVLCLRQPKPKRSSASHWALVKPLYCPSLQGHNNFLQLDLWHRTRGIYQQAQAEVLVEVALLLTPHHSYRLRQLWVQLLVHQVHPIHDSLVHMLLFAHHPLLARLQQLLPLQQGMMTRILLTMMLRWVVRRLPDRTTDGVLADKRHCHGVKLGLAQLLTRSPNMLTWQFLNGTAMVGVRTKLFFCPLRLRLRGCCRMFSC